MVHGPYRRRDEVSTLTTGEANLAGVVVAHNRHDAAGFAARFAPDGVIRILPTGDTVHGRAPIAAFLNAYLQAFPDWQLEHRGTHGGADATWLEWTITGTHAGRFMGHRATHRGLELPGCSRFTFSADGLIAEEGLYLDPASILRQLGLLLAAPTTERTPDDPIPAARP